jgi:hypothetical protein
LGARSRQRSGIDSGEDTGRDEESMAADVISGSHRRPGGVIGLSWPSMALVVAAVALLVREGNYLWVGILASLMTCLHLAMRDGRPGWVRG